MRLTSWNLLHGLATPVEGSHLPQKKIRLTAQFESRKAESGDSGIAGS